MLIRLSTLEKFPAGGGNFQIRGLLTNAPSVLARSRNLCCCPSSSNSSASSGLLSAHSLPKNTDILFSGLWVLADIIKLLE